MAGKLTAILLLLASLVGCKGYGGSHLKDTQECQLVFISVDHHQYYFVRPNSEIFVMNFDNPPEFRTGLKFHTITYYDDSADQVHFVKAQIEQ